MSIVNFDSNWIVNINLDLKYIFTISKILQHNTDQAIYSNITKSVFCNFYRHLETGPNHYCSYLEGQAKAAFEPRTVRL